MAELNVQRKERNVWPWILGGLIALALVFWLIQGRGGNTNVGATGIADSMTVGAPESSVTRSAAGTVDGSAVSEYLQFVDNRASREASPSHEHTADGLRRLSAALQAVASRDNAGGASWQPRIAEIRMHADVLQQDPTSSQHAQQTREAFVAAASLIDQMRASGGTSATRGTTATTATTDTTGRTSATVDSARYPTGAANATGSSVARGSLQQTAMTIDPSRPLLEQTTRIEHFFALAGDALRDMSGVTR
jgi:hypothetical protein